jgi:hypothetical protein
MWTTSEGDHAMLATRTIELQPTPLPEDESDPGADNAQPAA